MGLRGQKAYRFHDCLMVLHQLVGVFIRAISEAASSAEVISDRTMLMDIR